MRPISCKTTGLVIALALALAGSVQARQHQQHHPGGAQAPQSPTETDPGAPPPPQMTDQMQGMMGNMEGMMEHMQGMMEHMQGMMGGGGMMGRHGTGMMKQAEEEDEEEEDIPQRVMMGRHGMMGRGGMVQRHLERLAQQLELTEEQRMQMWTLLSTHAKEAIRLRADIETLGIDLRQLLEAEPVDLPQVKQVLQSMAGKEADLRFVHVTAMQEIGKALTPEQQQKLRVLRRRMMDHGGMRGHGGTMGHGRMMGPGRMMGRGPREK